MKCCAIFHIYHPAQQRPKLGWDAKLDGRTAMVLATEFPASQGCLGLENESRG